MNSLKDIQLYLLVWLGFDPMLLTPVLLPAGGKAEDRWAGLCTSSHASATLPHRKIFGDPAQISLQGP